MAPRRRTGGGGLAPPVDLDALVRAQNLQEAAEAEPGEEHTFVFDREDDGLGLVLVMKKGSDKPEVDKLVTRADGTPGCAETLGVRPSDVLLSLNGRPMAGVEFEEVVRLVCAADWPRKLRFWRPADAGERLDLSRTELYKREELHLTEVGVYWKRAAPNLGSIAQDLCEVED